MYMIRLNDDESLTTVVNQRIDVGYVNSDWFWFLIKPNYLGKKVANCNVTIEFDLPQSKKHKIETLSAKNEYYGEYLKYVLPKYSKITNEAGVVSLKLNITDDVSTFETQKTTIGISTDEDYHDDKQYDNPVLDGSGYDVKGCTCDHDADMQRLIEMTRPLIFDSTITAVDELNSDKYQNVYLGQSVIIVKNGKYVLYSVQQDENNNYIVEPVDTVGDGAVWEDEDD